MRITDTKEGKIMIRRVITVVALAALTTLGWAGTASADHNGVDATVASEGCQVTGETSWKEQTHTGGGAVLVVLANGEVTTAPVGTPLAVDLEPGTEEIKWRVWGGGERNYDSPALDDLAALIEYLDGGGTPLDADAPGVAWSSLVIPGCPAPIPSPSVDPSPSPAPSPTVDPTNPPASSTPTEAPTLPETSGLRLLPALLIVGFVVTGAGAALYYGTRKKSDPTP